MPTAIWFTGHAIADTIATSLMKGIPNAQAFYTSQMEEVDLGQYDAHIAYGILRGTADIFTRCERRNIPWFNVDRGYFGANHYDGTYRISYRGTQAKWTGDKQADHPLKQSSGYTLIAPPTAYVCEFFGIDYETWLRNAACGNAYTVIRHKGTPTPVNWQNVSKVITFNSSLGWQALERGIPVVSDPQHSVVGSYLATKPIDTCNTDELFTFMKTRQFTLAQIERGDAWEQIQSHLRSL